MSIRISAKGTPGSMHMADALISPAVGATMWGATAVTSLYCAKRLRESEDAARVPLMGVTGAFIFAAQMLNFQIPGTGSSGHLGGGLILAILLGPEAAFLVMASVLTVQALFFADGGLLSLGANVFNLGFFPAFIAFPLIYRKIAGGSASRGRVLTASLVAGVVGLQLGALGVVLETVLSGVSALPFSTFALLMQPIHLAIGIVEGLVTAAVVLFVRQARPELLGASTRAQAAQRGLKPVIVGLLVAALLGGGLLSWFASTNSDGLEWAVARATGGQKLSAQDPVHRALAAFQKRTALLPGYSFRSSGDAGSARKRASAGTSVSGILGAGLVLALAAATGMLLRRRSAARRAAARTDDSPRE